MGWLIAAGVLTLLAVMPVGATVRYDADGLLLKLVIGPVKLTLIPGKKKKPKEEKPVKKKQTPQEKRPGKPAAKEKKKGGSLMRFQGIVREALAFLGAFRRRLLVRNLQMELTLAGGDPCDLAVNYGRAWAALGNLMPQLERFLRIRKRNLEVACDFCADQTVITAYLDIVISIGRLLAITVWYGIRILREFLKLKNLSKGGKTV